MYILEILIFAFDPQLALENIFNLGAKYLLPCVIVFAFIRFLFEGKYLLAIAALGLGLVAFSVLNLETMNDVGQGMSKVLTIDTSGAGTSGESITTPVETSE